MTSTRTADRGIQHDILAVVGKSQSIVMGPYRSGRTRQFVTSSRPSLNLPYADRVPTQEKLVNSTYDLAERLLATPRKFARDVLEVTASRPARTAGA